MSVNILSYATAHTLNGNQHFYHCGHCIHIDHHYIKIDRLQFGDAITVIEISLVVFPICC